MRANDPPPGVKARRDSACPLCPEPVHVGDRVAFRLGEPAHVQCVRDAPDAA